MAIDRVNQFETDFHIDGPYNHDSTTEAARIIAAAVRYLNHATFSANSTPYPATLDNVTNSLSSALSGMDQLLNQLGTRMDQLAANPRVFADRFGDPVTVDTAASQYRIGVEETRIKLAAAQTRLTLACMAVGWLGIKAEG